MKWSSHNSSRCDTSYLLTHRVNIHTLPSPQCEINMKHLRWVGACAFGWQWAGQVPRQMFLGPFLPHSAFFSQEWEGQSQWGTGGAQRGLRGRREAGVCHVKRDEDRSRRILSQCSPCCWWAADTAGVRLPQSGTQSQSITRSVLSLQVCQEASLWRKKP